MFQTRDFPSKDQDSKLLWPLTKLPCLTSWDWECWKCQIQKARRQDRYGAGLAKRGIMQLIQKWPHRSAKPFFPKKKETSALLPLKDGQTVNKETKWSKMMHWSFFCFHIRPPFPTFDSEPLDLSFVQPSGASLPSMGIGIPPRCSHPRGFSIVFSRQRKKNHQSHSGVHTLRTTLHAHSFFQHAHGFHHDCPFPSPIRFHISLWHDEALARECQTRFRQKHQNIWRKIWNPSASLFLSSLICNILWATCQPVPAKIKVLHLSCRDIAPFSTVCRFHHKSYLPICFDMTVLPKRNSYHTSLLLLLLLSFCSSSLSHHNT